MLLVYPFNQEYMAKTSLNKAFFLFIITALLAMQWSSTHIHLAEHHDHDGSHHQHLSKGHLHDFAPHHADAIDVSHVDTHDKVVELDHECTSPSWNKLDDQPGVLNQTDYYFEHLVHCEAPGLLSITDSRASWLSYSIIRLRAPPYVTS